MSDWKEYPLGEICSLITDGKHGNCKDEGNSGYYFLSAKDVFNGKLHYENARQITRLDFEETDRRTNLKAGDLLITNSGTIGKIALALDIPETRRTTFQKSVAVLKPITDYLQSRFFYYAIHGNYAGLIELAEGTTQQNLLLGELRKFHIKIPPLPEQRAIASVLSSLDDKIDLLHHQNKTLEAIAETLFRQWFVEEAKEEWEEGYFSNFFRLMMGLSPKGDTYNEDGNGVPLLNGAADYNNGYKARKFTSDPKRINKIGDILFCIRATIGNIEIAKEEFCLGRGVAAISPKEEHFRYFVLLQLKRIINELISNASGSVILGLSKDDINNHPILIPPNELLLKFHKEINSVFFKLENNNKQIRTLEKLRDTLLPKLMSGEVRVKYEENN